MKTIKIILKFIGSICYMVLIPVLLSIIITMFLFIKYGIMCEGIGYICVVFFIMCPVIFGNIEPIGRFNHWLMEWHKPDDTHEIWTDKYGVNTHAVCKYCGKDIMQDSQGNWF